MHGCVVCVVPFVHSLEETIMKLKTALSLLTLACCAAISTSALAQSTGTLNIQGNISPVSCTPQLTGGAISGNTLTLPDAYIDNYTAAGSFGGETPFAFEWSGCQVSAGINNVWVHFGSDGVNIDANGRIVPTVGSQNMRFEMLNGSGGAVITAGGAAAAQPTATQGTSAQFTGTNPNQTATKQYAVRYYSTQALAIADAGPVQSAVTYNVRYY